MGPELQEMHHKPQSATDQIVLELLVLAHAFSNLVLDAKPSALFGNLFAKSTSLNKPSQKHKCPSRAWAWVLTFQILPLGLKLEVCFGTCL